MLASDPTGHLGDGLFICADGTMQNCERQVFDAKFESLEAVAEFVVRCAQAAGFDPKSVYGVQLAVDEACSNIIEHAYAGVADGVIECSCECNDATFTVQLHDHGVGFDPTCALQPDLTARLEDRRVGGLGIYFMRRLMDEITFETSADGGNVLILVKHRPQTP